MSFLYLVGATIGFPGNSKLTFASEGSNFSASVRYASVHAVGYAADFAMLSYFVDKLGYPHQIIQFAAVVLVAAYLFLAFKFFVFARPRISSADLP